MSYHITAYILSQFGMQCLKSTVKTFREGEKSRYFLSSTICKRKHESPTTSSHLIKFEIASYAKTSTGGGRIWEASVHSLHLSNCRGRLSSPTRGLYPLILYLVLDRNLIAYNMSI